MLKFEKSQYQNSIFELKYNRYEENVEIKKKYYRKIEKFELQNFFIRCIYIFCNLKNNIENRKFKF